MAAWSYFLFTGSIASLWPRLGIANQLVPTIAQGADGGANLVNATLIGVMMVAVLLILTVGLRQWTISQPADRGASVRRAP